MDSPYTVKRYKKLMIIEIFNDFHIKSIINEQRCIFFIVIVLQSQGIIKGDTFLLYLGMGKPKIYTIIIGYNGIFCACFPMGL